MNKEAFLKRFKQAEARKQTNWRTLYRDTMEIFCPQRENFYQNIPGEKKGRQVYTSSPYTALDKASNNMHSSLTPHMKRWVELKPGRLISKEEKKDAEVVLQNITRVLFDHIHASNFDLAASEFYKDICIGTAAILVSGTPTQPLIFTCVPLHELYILRGPLGTIDKVFRKYKVPAGAIKDTWGDAKIGGDIAAIAKDNPDKEVELVEGVVPKRIVVNGEERDGFGYYVCSPKMDGYLVQRDMPINPWIVARWSVLAGEEWGRGPAIVAYSDAKTLNEFIKLHLQSMQLTVHPMYTAVSDGVINIHNIRIGPGKIIPVAANGGAMGASIQPLSTGGQFNVGQLEIQRLEASINDQMYAEPLGPINMPVKTATEVSIRQQELSKRIGSAFGRLQYEFVKPLINACLYQLDRLGIVNMNDFKIDGQTISVDAKSPLAQGQAQEDINNVIQYVQFAVGAFGPQAALSMMKPDAIMDFMATELNVPLSIKLTDAEREQAKEQLQALALQQADPNAQIQQPG